MRSSSQLFAAVLGIALLLPCAAEAGVIYSGLVDQTIGSPGSYGLTRAGEPGPDFSINAFGPSGYWWYVDVLPVAGNAVAGVNTSDGGFATAFAADALIGSGSAWLATGQGGYLFDHTFFGYSGNWLDGALHFAGLVFNLADGPHYGWAQVSTNAGDIRFTIADWAYESEANVGIQAGQTPEPATMSVLLLGAAGLLVGRRQRS